MSKILSALLVSAIGLLAVACGGAAPGKVEKNVNTNSNAVASSTVDPANMPEGLSANEIRQPVNAPGIPNVVTRLPKGTTPTPGIPSEAELKKPFKPGATPTPGIPDQETIRRALGQRSTTANMPPPGGNNPPPMMKSNKVTGGKVH
ncbi:hypothetical protein BH10ACI3_BH10ACI3_23760 [soil metagenome]